MSAGVFAQVFTEQVAANVAAEGVIGCKEIICKFAGNYSKRRNVGFKVMESVGGSFQETKNYYSNIFQGKEPHEMEQAIIYNK